MGNLLLRGKQFLASKIIDYKISRLRKTNTIGIGLRLGKNVELVNSKIGDYCGLADQSSVRKSKIESVSSPLVTPYK